MAPTETTDSSLKITRKLPARVEEVFEAWTHPEKMVQWMGPGEVTCKEVSIDLKVGGRYRIHMVSPEGDHIAFGEYQEIVLNKKLKFTWGWEDGHVSNTTVTLVFAAKGDHTELTLLHENFLESEAAQKHTQGWNGCIDKLEAFVQN